MKRAPIAQSLFFTALVFSGNLCFAQAVSTIPQVLTKTSTPEVKKESAKLIQSELAAADFEKLGLTLSFDGPNLQLGGSAQPADCAEGLALKDVINHAPDADKEDRGTFESKDDLDSHTSLVGARVTYQGSFKSYNDCFNAHKDDEEKVDLQSLSALSKSVLSEKESAQAGLLDASNKVVLGKDAAQSATYKKLAKLLDDKDCKSCNANAKSIKKRVSEIAEQPTWAAPLMKGLIESGIASMADRLAKAKTLRELTAIREDLVSYANWISKLKVDSADKEQLGASVGQAMNQLQDKAQTLAMEDPTHAPRYADFISETYGKVAELPGLEKESKVDALNAKSAYAKGGEARIDFVSKADPDNSEVRNYLNNSQASIEKLQNDFYRNCQVVMNDRKFKQCGAMQHNLQIAQQQNNTLKQRFMEAQSMNNLVASGPMIFQSNFGNNRGQTPVGGNSTFGLNPSVFPNAQNFNQASAFNNGASASVNATNLFNANTTSVQPNQNSLYRVNSNPTIAVPLDSNYFQSNGQGINSPIKTGFTPSFQYQS